MPDVYKISIALTGEQIGALRAAVTTGDYATTSEVIREAVREWQRKRQLMCRRWKRGKKVSGASIFAIKQTRVVAKRWKKKYKKKRL
jgi:antitoxin ParD1/3/4